MSNIPHAPADGPLLSFVFELEIAAFRLPANAHPFDTGEHSYVALVRDSGQPWRCLMPLEFDWPSASRIIQAVCIDRAVKAVDGHLRVRRQQVPPEAYLRHWRRAIKRAEDITELIMLDNKVPSARFEFDEEVMSSARSGRSVPVIQDLTSLVRVVEYLRAGLFHTLPEASNGLARYRLVIDLTRPSGACLARWAYDFMRWFVVPDATQRVTAVIEMADFAVFKRAPGMGGSSTVASFCADPMVPATDLQTQVL